MPHTDIAPALKDLQLEYDRLFRNEPLRDDDRGYRWFVRQLTRRSEAPKRILDIACGGGFFLRELWRQTSGTVFLTGVDISQEALRIAARECPQAQFFLAAGEDLPFEGNTFDIVTCLGSLEHFVDRKAALSEMRRVADRAGAVAILVPNLFWYKDIWAVLRTGNRKSRNQTHEHFASLGEWKKEIAEAGLHIEKVLKYNGISRKPWKQWLKDRTVPLSLSYHLLFLCRAGKD